MSAAFLSGKHLERRTFLQGMGAEVIHVESTSHPDGMAFSNLESVRDFCARLRSCGCRIAIKDFGVGTGNLAAVQACRPDIVKLDASFPRRARESEFGRECLRDMLTLCAHLASHVVVDGVEREEDMDVALDAGARWLQGYYLHDAEEPERLASPTNLVQRRPA